LLATGMGDRLVCGKEFRLTICDSANGLGC
jgi:hypothetical protein